MLVKRKRMLVKRKRMVLKSKRNEDSVDDDEYVANEDNS